MNKVYIFCSHLYCQIKRRDDTVKSFYFSLYTQNLITAELIIAEWS